MIVRSFAPAKVNLTLHVTGQRADGYHLLDSLVAFADVGDRLRLEPAEATRLKLTGPMAAGVPADASNLVLRAAGLYDLPVAITLDKHLPLAAGIGGGSSDAAATLLAMAELTGSPLPAGATGLGADVPVCLMRQAARMRGIGEDVQPVTGLPDLHAVLANPGVAVPTPAVFRALSEKNGAPMPIQLPQWQDRRSAIDWIAGQRNDLETPAITRAPVIGEVLAALSTLPGARLARMSGSGATCFALFDTRAGADKAAEILATSQPGWWTTATTLR